ncbi:MAG: metal-binding protein [Actinomycetales bacterium]|nr:MAG: metal-binding protein [Actinomycetales bacterium]
MPRLDPDSPLVIDTRDLSRQPGSMREISRTVRAPEELGTDIVAVPAGAPVELVVKAEAVSEGVLISGSVAATADGACVRCLEPVTVRVTGSFQELFAYADRAAHHHEVGADSDEAEVHELVDDLVDLHPVLLDTVVPALPFQPVCRVDCPGLCSECGVSLAQEPEHRHDVVDPRWAALSGLGGLLNAHPTESPEERRN